MQVNLKDIAAYTNVSISTVSRVVNNKNRVNPETRKKILEALEKFKYIPDETARRLKSGVSKTIGIVVPDISNEFFSTIIRGAQFAASRENYSVIICDSGSDARREKEAVELLFSKQVSGLILATVSCDMGFHKMFSESNIPVVFVDNIPDTVSSFDCVVIDNQNAGFTLTNHLIELGHKKIAIITGNLEENSAYARLEGYRIAFRTHKMPPNDNYIFSGSFSMEYGIEAMERILELSDRPTALVASNNTLAYGALRVLLDRGLHIPEDFSIACFDASDKTGLLRPQLTSIIQPAMDIGRIASETILKKQKNQSFEMHEKVFLTPKLLIKESCRKV